ncbi:hypothetical protein CBS101457_006302 [Exobasidium rhododendri]|nr:hypothetical protein CBS101457_006302 [Exobasidium rhododendri]
MGIVFSYLASSFMFIGELSSTAFLALGEVGSLLVRGVFGLVVGICDILAACMCCCRVPFSDRPDRDGYTYTTLATNTFSNASFAAVPKILVLPSAVEKKSKEFSTSSLNKQTQVVTPKETQIVEKEKTAIKVELINEKAAEQ